MPLYLEPHKHHQLSHKSVIFAITFKYTVPKTYKATYFVGLSANACHHILEYFFLLYIYIFFFLCFMVPEYVTKWLRQAVARYGVVHLPVGWYLYLYISCIWL